MQVKAFKARNVDWETKIEGDYVNDIFVLKKGALEQYLGIRKDLTAVIEFCDKNLNAFLADTSNTYSVEMKVILNKILE